MAPIIRTLIISLVLCGIALLGYWRFTTDLQSKTIAELQAANADMERRLIERQAMIDRLSRSRRIAHIDILDQVAGDAGQISETVLQFIELDDRGLEVARQRFTIPGDVLYVDTWTVKFDAERVAEGHPMMGHTLILLRRIYSDRLAPRDGFLIDTPGAIPPGYAATEVGEFEKRIWEVFWTIATDAMAARRMGVRVAQGEAVYKPVRAGQRFELVVDAVGGTNLLPLPAGDVSLTVAGN